VKTKSTVCLQPGWFAAVTVTAGVFPARCYVGQIEAVDERGIRLTLIDWIIGTPSGYDLFVSWPHIEGAYVATDQHDLGLFIGEKAGKWQSQVDGTWQKYEDAERTNGSR
jgi:hypothetical protein